MLPGDGVWVLVAPLALTSTLKLFFDVYCDPDGTATSCGPVRGMSARASRLTLGIMYALTLLTTVIACLVIVPSATDYPARTPPYTSLASAPLASAPSLQWTYEDVAQRLSLQPLEQSRAPPTAPDYTVSLE